MRHGFLSHNQTLDFAKLERLKPRWRPLRRATMGTACYCRAPCSELRFCGRNTELAPGLLGPPSSLLSCEFGILPPCVRRYGLTTKSQQHQRHNRQERRRQVCSSPYAVCANLDAGWLQNNGPSATFSIDFKGMTWGNEKLCLCFTNSVCLIFFSASFIFYRHRPGESYKVSNRTWGH